MITKKTRKPFAMLAGIVLAVALMIGFLPQMAEPAYATDGNTITLGAGAITKDSRIYFGDEILWRVLQSGDGKAMLISNDTLAKIQFDNSSNVWAGSNAQAWCTNYYNDLPVGIEKDAILETSVIEENDLEENGVKYFYKGGFYDLYYGAAPLDSEHFFFLSVKEAAAFNPTRCGSAWWLRSPIVTDGNHVGEVTEDGIVGNCRFDGVHGARPAFNLDVSSVLFTSEISSESEKYNKLTLKDENLNIGVTKGKVMTWNGSTATIPYSISGTSATDQTKAYVLVTKEDYTKSNAEVLQYTELGAGKSGTRSFTLDTAKVHGEQGANFQIYLVAVNESGDKKSDYASTPAVLPYELRYDANGGTKTMKSQNVFAGEEFTFPECGFTAPQGKAFDYWGMSGVDTNGIFKPDSKVKIAINCVKDSVITVTAYWKDAAIVLKAPEAKDLTYSGSAQELVTNGEAENGEMNYAIGVDGITAPTTGWSASIPKGTDAGTYYVWYKAVGNPPYGDSAPELVSVTIAPPSPKPTPAKEKELMTKVTAKGKKSLVIGWEKTEGADGYDIFFARCNHNDKKITVKNVKEIKGNNVFTWKKSGLKPGTSYKAVVKAYVMKDGKKQYIGSSPLMHAYAGGGNGKTTNAKKVTVKKASLCMKVGKKVKIKAKVIPQQKNRKLMPKSHVPTLRYLSTNTKIATVDAKGKVKGVSKGTCCVYAYAHNGVFRKVKVTVK